jgi:hypothetical protein
MSTDKISPEAQLAALVVILVGGIVAELRWLPAAGKL